MATKTSASFVRKRTFIIVAAFSLIFFMLGAGLTIALANSSFEGSWLFAEAKGRLKASKEYSQVEERAIARQQAYVDYSRPAAAPTATSNAEKQHQLELFDKAFKEELTTCSKQSDQKVDYAKFRKINQYANRVVARSCAGGDAMYFLNRNNEWQRSVVNIVQEFASATSWLKACYLEDILPNRETQPESSKYIGQSNQIECEYIAKWRVPMTREQHTKTYEERYNS